MSGFRFKNFGDEKIKFETELKGEVVQTSGLPFWFKDS